MAKTGTDIQEAAAILQAGGLVAIPTETVYGLAANALSDEAVLKIFKAKDRPFFNPLIVHCSSLQAAEKYALHFPDKARQLAEAFWPGPLTLILPKTQVIPDLVTAGLPYTGVRVPAHPLTLALLQLLPFPLAAPSANPFGYVSPTTAAHVAAQMGERVDYILDGGPCQVGLESSIVSFATEKPSLLRYGGISPERIEAITGTLQLETKAEQSPLAPGQLAVHYAPGKKLLLGSLDELYKTYSGKKLAVLSLQKVIPGIAAEQQIQLSPSGNLDEAARHIFAALRQLDEMPVDLIIAEFMPDEGLGRAINDRLRRAAAR